MGKERELARNPKKGHVAGVCQGLGEYTDTHPLIWRVALIFIGPPAILAYLVSWVTLPDKGKIHENNEEN